MGFRGHEKENLLGHTTSGLWILWLDEFIDRLSDEGYRVEFRHNF